MVLTHSQRPQRLLDDGVQALPDIQAGHAQARQVLVALVPRQRLEGQGLAYQISQRKD